MCRSHFLAALLNQAVGLFFHMLLLATLEPDGHFHSFSCKLVLILPLQKGLGNAKWDKKKVQKRGGKYKVVTVYLSWKKNSHDSFKRLPEHCKCEAGGVGSLILQHAEEHLCTSSSSSTYTSTRLQSHRASDTTCFMLTAIPAESLETCWRNRCSSGFHLLPLQRCRLLRKVLGVEKVRGDQMLCSSSGSLMALKEVQRYMN